MRGVAQPAPPRTLILFCRYAAAKHSYGARWPLKTDDFFPYADNPHAFWTGGAGTGTARLPPPARKGTLLCTGCVSLQQFGDCIA